MSSTPGESDTRTVWAAAPPPGTGVESTTACALLGGQEAFDSETLAELGRLGARLVMQRALEEEVAAFLGRARYERTPQARGQRNGVRPKRRTGSNSVPRWTRSHMGKCNRCLGALAWRTVTRMIAIGDPDGVHATTPITAS